MRRYGAGYDAVVALAQVQDVNESVEQPRLCGALRLWRGAGQPWSLGGPKRSPGRIAVREWWRELLAVKPIDLIDVIAGSMFVANVVLVVYLLVHPDAS